MPVIRQFALVRRSSAITFFLITRTTNRGMSLRETGSARRSYQLNARRRGLALARLSRIHGFAPDTPRLAVRVLPLPKST